MSKREKGKRAEREADELYENAGWQTYRPQESKWGETDIFGLFDILALGPSPEPTHLIQVKSNGHYGDRGLNSWCELALQYARDGVRVRMMIRYDRSGWRVIDPVPGGYQTVLDERKSDCDIGDKLQEYLNP